MIYLILYILTIVGSNVLLLWLGVVPVGFGLMAPAGVYLVGLTFSLRDGVQETMGKRWSIAGIIIGAAISALFSWQLALASATAFCISELLDLSVYTWIRQHNLLLAVAASNIIGILVDTYVFLPMADIPMEFATGQIVGKLYGTVVAVGILLLRRRLTPATIAL
jgi:uncharacterized PurR-regulated membrane protein YhhQ (DUF165 family)